MYSVGTRLDEAFMCVNVCVCDSLRVDTVFGLMIRFYASARVSSSPGVAAAGACN